MKVLFLCTAFNSLSQRVALVLKSHGHSVTIELALSPDLMTTAAELASPDIIICPFLTKKVPPAIYNRWLTLIVHPGPPGDAGPSALDWTLLGDSGTWESAEEELVNIDIAHRTTGTKQFIRSHWGVTVLQAIEAFDAGPVWAFDQFKLDQGIRGMSKSDLYRGPITRAAVNAVLAAIEIVRIVAERENQSHSFSPLLTAPEFARTHCVSKGLPFQGGKVHNRPLLKASARDFFQLNKETKLPMSAEVIVQRIRCADSQPGVLTNLFGTPMFVYNAIIQREPLPPRLAMRAKHGGAGTVLATRDGAVLVEVGADYPIWICYLRRPKAKSDRYLHPKLPATMALTSIPAVAETLNLFSDVEEWSVLEGMGLNTSLPWERCHGTYQQVWVELEEYNNESCRIGYVHSEFYNGAFSTHQCEILLEALNWTLAQPGIKAIVMLGGNGYFSNGIALNVIEGCSDPSAEGWANINAIDNCVEALLAPAGVVTFATIRGNAAAGGLALATAADVVLCAESAVLNPHYRGVGLFGSEYHTYSWYERCGADIATKFARNMLPMSSREAHKIGLVDMVIDNDTMSSDRLLLEMKNQVLKIMTSTTTTSDSIIGAPWTRSLRPESNMISLPLSAYILRNKTKFLAYMFACDGQGYPSVGERFQKYRKQELDQMTLDFFHPHRNKRFATRCTAFVRKLLPISTPFRFALHMRYGSQNWCDATSVVKHQDEEELDEFDFLGGVTTETTVTRLPSYRPECVRKLVRSQESFRPIMSRYNSWESTASTLYSPKSSPSLDDHKIPETQPFMPIMGLIPLDCCDKPPTRPRLGFRCYTDLNLADQPSDAEVINNTSSISLPDQVAIDAMASAKEAPILWSCYYSESDVLIKPSEVAQTMPQIEHSIAAS